MAILMILTNYLLANKGIYLPSASNANNYLLMHLIGLVIFLVIFLVILAFSYLEPTLLHRRRIFFILILGVFLELIASMLILSQVQPALEKQPTTYRFGFKYNDYSEEWIKSANEQERLCIKNYREKIKDRNLKCKDYQDEYIRQEKIFKTEGKGWAYLSCENRVNWNVTPRQCQGIGLYKFSSDENHEIGTSMTIKKLIFKSKEEIEIDFLQEASTLVLEEEGTQRCIIRPQSEFSITAKREPKENSKKFFGKLKHASKEIDIADFTLCMTIDENECKI
ncbi:MAG: hypothetical protein AB4063_17215 [Crocosphaera sp.]